MCLLAVSAQQCTMPAISAHDLRLNHRRFNQTRMASVLAGEGGRHGHPPGQPGGPAAHHQLCALHPLLCRAEAHRRAVPWALQGLPRSFSRLSPLLLPRCSWISSRILVPHHRALGGISNTVTPVPLRAAPCQYSPGRVAPSPEHARLPPPHVSGPS